MSKQEIATQGRQLYGVVQRSALTALGGGDEQVTAAAAARVAQAFLSAQSASRDPSAWDRLSPASVSAAVGTSIATDLYPGGPMPAVYLVPQSGQLQWRITHRGLAELARRAGYDLRSVPVGVDDHLVESLGLVVEHEQRGTRPHDRTTLRGVIVVVRDRRSGDEQAHMVDVDVIEARRAKSQMSNKGPWRDWYIEMAIKTAILYLGARGTLPLSTGMRAAIEAERVQASIRREPPQHRGKAALPDYSEPYQEPEPADAEYSEPETADATSD